MEGLPADLCLKIFCWLDHQNLATAQLVCKKWSVLASDNALWSNIYKERWGVENATFTPQCIQSRGKTSMPFKTDVTVLDWLKIIREADDYYLVHQGEIQRHLGSRRLQGQAMESLNMGRGYSRGKSEEKPCSSLLDSILFFVGDLEATSLHAKRSQLD